MNKRCSRCLKEQDIKHFQRNNKVFKTCNLCSVYQSKNNKNNTKQCPSCLKKREKTEYDKKCKICKECSKMTSRQRQGANTKGARLLQTYIELKKAGNCVDCAEDDWRVLEFDHVRGDKIKEVRRMTTEKTMREEAAKCELRCCNCHLTKSYHTEGTHRIKNPVTYHHKRRATARSYVEAYKLKNGCIDCGEKDDRCLQFDHVDPGNKFKNISRLISSSASIETIKLEIQKCELRCGNCHRLKTLKQFNYQTYKNVEYK